MPRTSRLVTTTLALILGALSIACGSTGGGSNNGGGTQTDTGGSTAAGAAATKAPSSAAAPAGPFVAFKDGTYEVGTTAGKVKPGTYKTTVPADSSGCYWERLKGMSGGMDDIIANDNINAGVPGIVAIKASDKGFTTHGCGEWKLSG